MMTSLYGASIYSARGCVRAPRHCVLSSFLLLRVYRELTEGTYIYIYISRVLMSESALTCLALNNGCRYMLCVFILYTRCSSLSLSRISLEESWLRARRARSMCMMGAGALGEIMGNWIPELSEGFRRVVFMLVAGEVRWCLWWYMLTIW